jgi:hypothetical protein
MIYTETPPKKHLFFDRQDKLDDLLLCFQKHGNIIVAVDFDDTIRDSFNKGLDLTPIHDIVKRAKNIGCKIVIYTARNKSEWIEVTEYCNDIGIEYDAINEDVIKLPKPTSGKIYYNIFLDDRAGLRESFEILTSFVETVEKQIKDENKKNKMKTAVNELLVEELVTTNTYEANLLKFLEESFELGVEVIKTLTKGEKLKPPIEKLHEECAHVEIRLAVLKKIIGEKECDAEINKKQNEIAQAFQKRKMNEKT